MLKRQNVKRDAEIKSGRILYMHPFVHELLKLRGI